MRILIVGSGAREHAIARAFSQSSSKPTLFCCATSQNPGIEALTQDYWVGDINCVNTVIKQILPWNIDLVMIGPEAPLEQGLADALEQQGIATVGPKKKLAQLETSKTFTRTLLSNYEIPGSLLYRSFTKLTGVMDFLQELGEGRYVIKADGLMGGKGVKVAGDHLHSFEEAYQFCATLTQQGQSFVIEEKLIGQEFSMLSFCDGEHLIPMPLVQDHKRAFVNDKGPNTGGMGSYSDANHSLPFLTPEDIKAAHAINQAVIKALIMECGEPYKGILYGSFMATSHGVQLIEYNARFGDPEAMNVLSILDSDLTDICQSLVAGNLQANQVQFKPLATVCKYAVPLGYPDRPQTNQPLDVSQVINTEQLYFAALTVRENTLYTSGSRALAIIGIAPTLAEAERIAEQEINRIEGPLFHRKDIGTAQLINQRIQMMQQLREKSSPL
jgi:phosphoribosylamine--glycine ligase